MSKPKKSPVETFLEESLKPDPDSGFNTPANSDPKLRQVDFGDTGLLEDLRTFLQGQDDSLPLGIPGPRNQMVEYSRRWGGHASGGGGPC